jgi:hypothetical protein
MFFISWNIKRQVLVETGLAVLLVLLMVGSGIISMSFFADDLGFDFAGYAVRYQNTFSGWFFNHHFGVPAGTFDAWFPALLPLFFLLVGFGSFTSPLAISILIARLALIGAIVFVARAYSVRTSSGFLIGALVAVNPITFKFLNRYYELFAWVLFLFAILFLLRYLNNRNSQKSFVLATVFSALVGLSHPVPSFFLVLFILFAGLFSRADVKKIVVFALFSAGLGFFWLGPFFAYSGYSSIQSFTDSLLVPTIGMFVSSLVLIVLLVLVSIVAFRVRLSDQYPREARVLFLTTGLGIVHFLFPNIPILNKVFVHSYHFFYIIVLMLTLFVLLRSFQKISLPPLVYPLLVVGGIIAISAGLLFLPKIVGNYSFVEPRLSAYSIDHNPIDFTLIDKALQKIPENTRFGILPHDGIVLAYAAQKYDTLAGFGWGYNAVALYNSDIKASFLLDSGRALFSETITRDCGLFTSRSRDLGIQTWIALTPAIASDLTECGWHAEFTGIPASFSPPLLAVHSLVENGILLERSLNRLVVHVNPPVSIVKMNYFPRWTLSDLEHDAKLSRDPETNFMRIETVAEQDSVLQYAPSFFDTLALLVSCASVLLLGLLVRRGHFS